MKIKIDDKKVVWFCTLILKVRNLEEEKRLEDISKNVQVQKREVYQTICKNSKNELEAYNEAMIEAQKKWHIIKVEAKTMSMLTPIIFK